MNTHMDMKLAMKYLIESDEYVDSSNMYDNIHIESRLTLDESLINTPQNLSIANVAKHIAETSPELMDQTIDEDLRSKSSKNSDLYGQKDYIDRNTRREKRRKLRELRESLKPKYVGYIQTSPSIQSSESEQTVDFSSILTNIDILDVMSKNDIDFLQTIAGVSRFHRNYALEKFDKLPAPNVYLYNEYINHKIYVSKITETSIFTHPFNGYHKLIDRAHVNTVNINIYHKSYTFYIQGDRIPIIDINVLTGYQIIIDGNKMYHKEPVHTLKDIIYKKCKFFPYKSDNMIFIHCNFNKYNMAFMDGNKFSNLTFYECTFDISLTILVSGFIAFVDCKFKPETMDMLSGSVFNTMVFTGPNIGIRSLDLINPKTIITNSSNILNCIKHKSHIKVTYNKYLKFCERMNELVYLYDHFPIYPYKIAFNYLAYSEEQLSDVFEDEPINTLITRR